MARVAPIQVPLSHRYPLPQTDAIGAPIQDEGSWLSLLPDPIARIIERRLQKDGEDDSKKAQGDQEVETLQVSVLITMPSPPIMRRSDLSSIEKAEAGARPNTGIEEEEPSSFLNEYVLGVAEVPWKGAIDVS